MRAPTSNAHTILPAQAAESWHARCMLIPELQPVQKNRFWACTKSLFCDPVITPVVEPFFVDALADPNRCERAYTGNTIGQANAVSDRVLDLRQCKLSGANLSGKTLSGALLADTDLSKSNLREAVLTKVRQFVSTSSSA